MNEKKYVINEYRLRQLLEVERLYVIVENTSKKSFPLRNHLEVFYQNKPDNGNEPEDWLDEEVEAAMRGFKKYE